MKSHLRLMQLHKVYRELHIFPNKIIADWNIYAPVCVRYLKKYRRQNDESLRSLKSTRDKEGLVKLYFLLYPLAMLDLFDTDEFRRIDNLMQFTWHWEAYNAEK